MKMPTLRLPSGPAMPSMTMDTSKLVAPLRIVQGLFAILTLGMTAYVSNWWRNYWHDSPPAEINYLIFASTFTLFSLVFLVAAPKLSSNGRRQFAPPAIVLGVEGVAMTFWFAGFVALAVFLSSRICFGNVCNIARAAVAFAALQWLLFAATTIIAGMQMMRAKQGPSLPAPKNIEEAP